MYNTKIMPETLVYWGDNWKYCTKLNTDSEHQSVPVVSHIPEDHTYGTTQLMMTSGQTWWARRMNDPELGDVVQIHGRVQGMSGPNGNCDVVIGVGKEVKVKLGWTNYRIIDSNVG